MDGSGADPGAVASRLVAFVLAQVEEFAARHAPGFDLPRVFAGHRTGPDVRAELAFTLGLLAGHGHDAVAGVPVEDAVRTVLRDLDGAATHSFSSYRVAETLRRWGRFPDHPLLAGFSETEVAAVVEACDSTSFLPLIADGRLPRNYHAVLARCEIAREALGLLADDADAAGRVGALVDGARALFTANPLGFLDDSTDGRGRYDIYTCDLPLFCQPFSDALEPGWSRTLAAALALVDRTGAPNGAAITWGRSIGALAACMTVELGALGVARGAVDDPARWLGRVDAALDHLEAWFAGGVVTAHQYRSPMAYRGPFRRLQMTFDCLGKLAQAAADLRAAPGGRAGDEGSSGGRAAGAVPGRRLHADHDALVPLERDRLAAVWSHRSRHLAFVVPFVGEPTADYLPAPRAPGTFEVPVDADLPTGVPVCWYGPDRHTVAGLPVALDHAPGRLAVEHDGFPASGRFGAPVDRAPRPGRRRAEYRVDGRTLAVREELRFDGTVPDVVALQVAEVPDRPLRVTFSSNRPHRTTVVDTAGIAEYRSFWSELPRVHQVDVDPAPEVTLDWTVTVPIRVAGTSEHHWYHRSIYGPIAAEVESRPAPPWPTWGRRALAGTDVLHLMWPEWSIGRIDDPGTHRDLARRLRRAGVPIVWTQHNRLPHDHRDRDAAAVYQVWAEHTDVAIHHSAWGRDVMLAEYRFGASTRHVVIPHVHWGSVVDRPDRSRAEVEAELGLEPCGLRIGIVGAPRRTKRTVEFAEAFAASTRSDLQLYVCSLAPGERVPDDPRIVALEYETVDRAVYDARVSVCDVLALPWSDDADMLTTGVVGDVFAWGLPALVGDWPYLHEALGAAAIPLGLEPTDWTATLDALDPAQVADAAGASRRGRDAVAPDRIAAAHLAVLDDLGLRP